MISRVARLELQKLTSAPITWCVVALFLLKTGLDLSAAVEAMFDAQRYRGSVDLASYTLLTGLFSSVAQSLFVVMPLLTMGLISQEVSSGTIKLIYSSPVSLRSFVLGKFTAIFAYCLVFVVLTGGFAVSIASFIPHFEWQVMIGGLLGLLALAACYAAIGMFVSALTSLQVVAAIVTLALFLGLNYLGNLAQGTPVLGDVFYWLAISRHADAALQGLLQSKDILYFAIITIAFLGFCYGHLVSRTQRPSARRGSQAVMAAVAGFAMVLGFFFSQPAMTKSADLTATKLHSLNSKTSHYLEALEGPLMLRTYYDVLDSLLLTGGAQARERRAFVQYQRVKPDIRFNFSAFYGSSPRTAVLRHRADLTPAEKVDVLTDYFNINEDFPPLDELLQDHPELEPVLTSAGLKVFEHQQRHVAVQPEYNDFYNRGRVSEEEYAAAIKQLTQDSVGAGFLLCAQCAGLSDTKSSDWGMLIQSRKMRHSLVNNGFDVARVGPDYGPDAKELDLLVVANPKVTMSPAELALIERHVASGGNLLLAIEPEFVEANTELLAMFGLRPEGGMLKGSDAALPDEIVLAAFADSAVASFDPRVKQPVATPTAARLSAVGNSNGFDIAPALVDARKQTVVWALSRQINGAEQRILVSADSDLFSNSLAQDLRAAGELIPQRIYLVEDLFAWLSHDAFPVRLRESVARDTSLSLTLSSINHYKIFYSIIAPLLALFFGALILFHRRRR